MIPKYTLKQVFKHTIKSNAIQKSISMNSSMLRNYANDDDSNRRDEIRKSLLQGTSISFSKSNNNMNNRNQTRPRNRGAKSTNINLTFEKKEKVSSSSASSFEQRRKSFLEKLRPPTKENSGFIDLENKKKSPKLNLSNDSIFSKPKNLPQGGTVNKNNKTRYSSGAQKREVNEKAMPGFSKRKNPFSEQMKNVKGEDESQRMEADTKRSRTNRLIGNIATALEENLSLFGSAQFLYDYQSTLAEQHEQNYEEFKAKRVSDLRSLKKYVEMYEKNHDKTEFDINSSTEPVYVLPRPVLNKHGIETSTKPEHFAGIEMRSLENNHLLKKMNERKKQYRDYEYLEGLVTAFNVNYEPIYLRKIIESVRDDRLVHKLNNANTNIQLIRILEELKEKAPMIKIPHKEGIFALKQNLIEEKLEKNYDAFFEKEFGGSKGRLDNRLLTAVKRDLLENGIQEELDSLTKNSKSSEKLDVLLQKKLGKINQYTDDSHIGVLVTHGGNHHVASTNHAMIHRERLLDTLSKRAKRLERQPMPYYQDTESLYQIRRTGKHAIRAPLIRYVQPYLDRIPEGTIARERLESHAGTIMKNKSLSLSEKVKGVAFLTRVYERFNLPKYMKLKPSAPPAYTHLEHRPKVYEDHDAFFIKKEQL
mmetsp:Transcript_6755/g.9820  ORF Transcript_6755/g.9820 Transcript_6755/m.9820 type:complete len:647 (-) Transcript_6755:1781-3721(-)